MEPESAPEVSRVRRLASTVYDASGGARSPLLDGPWWLIGLSVVVVGVLVLGSAP